MDPQVLLRDLTDKQKRTILDALKDIKEVIKDDKTSRFELVKDWKSSKQPAIDKVTCSSEAWSARAERLATMYRALRSQVSDWTPVEGLPPYKTFSDPGVILDALIGTFSAHDDLYDSLTSALGNKTFKDKETSIQYQLGDTYTVETLKEKLVNAEVCFAALAKEIKSLKSPESLKE